MTWKENWVFPALDTEHRVASLFHFSLRPSEGEGIFTAKLAIDGLEHRYVGRSSVPRDPTELVTVANDRLALEVTEPCRAFRISYRSDELDADLRYAARFRPFDFDQGPLAPGDSPLGERGRHVFHFRHYEQALLHEGELTLKAGPRAGETIALSGYANRDHSWGWRQDLTFRHHQWLCASFDDRYVQGTVMNETCYPHGDKHGGFVSTDMGNDPVCEVAAPDAYWLTPGEPLPVLDRDVRYRLRTVSDEILTVVAHIASDYGRLYLNARSPDRTQVYQDVEVFCDMTLEETGQRGAGVLELGKFYDGPGAAELTARSASRAGA